MRKTIGLLLCLALTACAGQNQNSNQAGMPNGLLTFSAFQATYCQHLHRFENCNDLYTQYQTQGGNLQIGVP